MSELLVALSASEQRQLHDLLARFVEQEADRHTDGAGRGAAGG